MTVQIPNINPIKLVVKDLQYNYNIKHLDIALQANQIYSFQSKKYYYQKFNKTDLIYFQLISDFGGCTVTLVDCEDNQIAVGTSVAINNTFYNIPNVCYGCSINLNTVPDGYYYVKVIVGFGLNATTLISEPILVADNFPNTALFEYYNTSNINGVIFQNNEKFYLRCEAVLHDFQPQSIDTVFEDENADLITLSSFKFRTYKLIIGNSLGVADWMIDKLANAFGVSNTYIDGLQFTKQQGAKFERNSDRLVPLAGWTLEVRETKSRNGTTIINNLPQTSSVVVSYLIEPFAVGNLTPVTVIQIQ